MSEVKEQVTKTKESKSFKEPATFTVKGEILAVDVMKNRAGEELGIMVKLYNAEDGKTIEVITSEGMMEKFTSNGSKYADIVVKGNTCAAVIGIVEEGITGYLNDKGEVAYHRSSGNVLNSITPLSNLEYGSITRRLAEKDRYEARNANIGGSIMAAKKAFIAAGYTDEEVKELLAKSLTI